MGSAGAINWVLQEPPIGFCRSHQLVSAGATNLMVNIVYFVSFGHKLVSAGATNWVLQEPPIGFCRSHQVVSAGATNWFLQEPPIGFCRNPIADLMLFGLLKYAKIFNTKVYSFLFILPFSKGVQRQRIS